MKQLVKMIALSTLFFGLSSLAFAENSNSENNTIKNPAVYEANNKKYENLIKKGKKRADVLIIQNNKLQLPMPIDHTVDCIQKTTIEELKAFGKTPNNAFKKWMKHCDFTGVSQSISAQKAIEQKEKLQKTIHEYDDITVPKNIIEEIVNPAHFDTQTKTILGNMNIPEHNISSQQTESLKILGIEELIGVGISNYKGSNASRKKNFINAADKFNGKIVHPGETFSVIAALSPFTHENGYTEGKVIKEGESDEEMGGGVCQSVTTIFRAWHNAGLEVSKTKPHSKVIGYYGGIGLDATIYEASTPKYNIDLLLKNDSNNSVLIKSIDAQGYQAILIYGTKEREVDLQRTSFEKTTTGQVAKWEKKTTNINTGETKNLSFTQKQTRDEK